MESLKKSKQSFGSELWYEQFEQWCAENGKLAYEAGGGKINTDSYTEYMKVRWDDIYNGTRGAFKQSGVKSSGKSGGV